MSGNGKKRAPLVADKRYSTTSPPKKQVKRKATKTKATRQKRPAPPRKRGPIGWVLAPFIFLFRLIWAFTWRIGAVVAIIIAIAVYYFASQLPPMTELVDGRTRGSVTLTDFTGETFAWRGDQFGGMVTAENVSPYLHDAVVATEDKRFYWHPGIDPRGIASAVRINLRAGRGPLSGNGGSTITQQTAKLLCLGVPYDPQKWETEAAYEADCRRTTLWRKAKEAIFAMAMEVAYTKEEVLSIYINRAYLGSGSRGFEAAAQRYFGISAADVNPAQAAMLAGLLKAPSTYAPTGNIDRARSRAAVVIGLMKDQGYVTADEAQDAIDNPASLSQAAQKAAGGFFADWVMESGPDFFTRDTTEDVIIRTTIDQDIQTAAEDALISVFENQVREGSEAQAAIVVMSADGAVRAMVGGRNIRATGAFNRATQALRQTGSAFKPFVYGAALEMGWSPYDLIDDKRTCWTRPGSGEWCPRNYDERFKGPITLTQALAESRNVPAVILSEEVGREATRTVATQFGIESDFAAGPALALGVSESTLIEMTGAFAGILNGGQAVTPYGMIDLRVKGDNEPLMDASTAGIGERVISQSAARQLTWMMSQVVEAPTGTGRRAKIEGWQIAGKSGTTQAARDAWFVAFTGDYVTGVWMGYDDNRPLTGVTGGGLPAEIWRETMTRVLADKTPTPLPMEEPVDVSSGVVLEGQGGVVTNQEINNVLDNILNGPTN